MAKFTVDTHLFRELGELLVGRDSTALIELIKNAYDANATEVTVYGEQLDNPEEGHILVTDNGVGMNTEAFTKGFLRVASRLKELGERRSTLFQRRYTGAKGIGRLAAHKLAKKLEIDSVPRLSELDGTREALNAIIDWDAIEQYETLDELDSTDAIRMETKPKENVYKLTLQCLHTRPSNKYEAGGRRGGQKIRAVISGTWDLRPLGKGEIEFCGIASTRIALYASDKPKTRLAMWRLELGDEKSPGCYVYAHILGDSVDPRFPKSLPIPRLPSLFVTPMSAIEFVLGELFQDEWAKATASNAKHVQNWRALQKKWLQQLFLWYQDQIERMGSSSWVALKEAKPEDDIFLPKSRRRSRDRNKR